jgi:hypothetical protein
MLVGRDDFELSEAHDVRLEESFTGVVSSTEPGLRLLFIGRPGGTVSLAEQVPFFGREIHPVLNVWEYGCHGVSSDVVVIDGFMTS